MKEWDEDNWRNMIKRRIMIKKGLRVGHAVNVKVPNEGHHGGILGSGSMAEGILGSGSMAEGILGSGGMAVGILGSGSMAEGILGSGGMAVGITNLSTRQR
jgi:hypothetical protein